MVEISGESVGMMGIGGDWVGLVGNDWERVGMVEIGGEWVGIVEISRE